MFLHLYVSFKEFKDKFWFLSTFKDINIFERNLRTSRRPGPHIDASLFSWQRAVALLLRSCRCFSNLVIWCLSSSFVVFQAFSLNHLYPSVQLVLTVCCRPFAERARAISVFSPLSLELKLKLCLWVNSVQCTARLCSLLSFCLSYLGWHMLPSHASAEACLTG